MGLQGDAGDSEAGGRWVDIKELPAGIAGLLTALRAACCGMYWPRL